MTQWLIPIHYEDTLNEADVFLVGTALLSLWCKIDQPIQLK